MSERIEILRQQARAEAAERAFNLKKAQQLSDIRREPLPEIAGRAVRRISDRSPCVCCGTRGDIGCKHRRPE